MNASTAIHVSGRCYQILLAAAGREKKYLYFYIIVIALLPTLSVVSFAELPEKPLRLIKDTDDNRLLSKSYLKKTSHSLGTAEYREIAINKCTHAKFDPVLMDMQMLVTYCHSCESRNIAPSVTCLDSRWILSRTLIRGGNEN